MQPGRVRISYGHAAAVTRCFNIPLFIPCDKTRNVWQALLKPTTNLLSRIRFRFRQEFASYLVVYVSMVTRSVRVVFVPEQYGELAE